MLRGGPWPLGALRSSPLRSAGRVSISVFFPRPITVLTGLDRKSTRLNSSHSQISYAVFCLKKKKSNQSALSQSRLSPVQPRFHSRNGGSSHPPRRRLLRGTIRDRYRLPDPFESEPGLSCPLT